MHEIDWMVQGRKRERFLAACKAASENDQLFRVFKTNADIQQIFCHTKRGMAKDYRTILEKLHPEWIALCNDYNEYQYYGVYAKMENLLGSFTGKRVCEIGGGYGGQAECIFKVATPACYHIIDLEEVVQLQRRYLNKYPVECYTELTGQDYDVVISNYAYSEVVNPTREIYRNFLISTPSGYITFNTDIDIDFGEVLPDIERESKENRIVWWKNLRNK